MYRVRLWIECIAFFAGVVLLGLWARYPQGNYEPFAGLCACVGVAFELYRRFGDKEEVEPGEVPIDTVPSLTRWLIANVPTAELSRTLPYALRLAQKVGNKDFEKWCRLELNGYYDRNGMAGDDEVPKHRTVVGRHADALGRPFMIEDPSLTFVNESRLRNGVKELERFAEAKEMIAEYDAGTSAIIRDTFHVNVIKFMFSPVSVSGTLSEIRNHLLERIYQIRDGTN